MSVDLTGYRDSAHTLLQWDVKCKVRVMFELGL